MDPLTWLEQLQRDLDAIRAAGVPDRDVAYGLMATRSGSDLDETLLTHADPILRLAWLLNVRAPALELRWLVKGVLATDKVYWEVLPLADLVARLRELELAAADRHGDVAAWLGTPVDNPELTRIRATAAALPDLLAADGPILRDRVRADIDAVQACTERGDLLDLAIDPGPRG